MPFQKNSRNTTQNRQEPNIDDAKQRKENNYCDASKKTQLDTTTKKNK